MHATRPILIAVLERTLAALALGDVHPVPRLPSLLPDKDEACVTVWCTEKQFTECLCAELLMFITALNMTLSAHRRQTRKATGLPYAIHPVEMTLFLLRECNVTDIEILAASLLHDTVEDTAVSLEDIGSTVSRAAACIVAEVTDDRSPGVSQQARKRAQVEHAHKMTRWAAIVKAADMWHNLTSLLDASPPSWSVDHIQGYFRWKYEVFSIIVADLPPKLTEALRCIFDSATLTPSGDPALRCSKPASLEAYYQDHCSAD